jgi:hypothetical protein
MNLCTFNIISIFRFVIMIYPSIDIIYFIFSYFINIMEFIVFLHYLQDIKVHKLHLFGDSIELGVPPRCIRQDL